jgi:hypothetical protein
MAPRRSAPDWTKIKSSLEAELSTPVRAYLRTVTEDGRLMSRAPGQYHLTIWAGAVATWEEWLDGPQLDMPDELAATEYVAWLDQRGCLDDLLNLHAEDPMMETVREVVGRIDDRFRAATSEDEDRLLAEVACYDEESLLRYWWTTRVPSRGPWLQAIRSKASGDTARRARREGRAP